MLSAATFCQRMCPEWNGVQDGPDVLVYEQGGFESIMNQSEPCNSIPVPVGNVCCPWALSTIEARQDLHAGCEVFEVVPSVNIRF